MFRITVTGSFCIVLLLMCAVSQDHGQSSKPDLDKLQLNLTVLTPTVKKGEYVKVRIELKNNGKFDLPVARDLLCITNGPTCLALEFEDERGTKYEGEILHATMSTEAYSDWWTLIAPSHYYGVDERLEGLAYDFLARPGRYKVTARYVSKGGLMPPSREAWKGEVVSNAAMFQVLPSKK